MSSMVSLSPSFRNQSNDSRWMSIRLGRSRTCLRRENDLRARGAVTELAKKKASLTGYEVSGEAEKNACRAGRPDGRRNPPGYRSHPSSRKRTTRGRLSRLLQGIRPVQAAAAAARRERLPPGAG